jgi:hypothetical protein
MKKAVLIVDRHRFDADLDPNFHFDADPDPDWRLKRCRSTCGSYPKFYTWKIKRKEKLDFYSFIPGYASLKRFCSH